MERQKSDPSTQESQAEQDKKDLRWMKILLEYLLGK